MFRRFRSIPSFVFLVAAHLLLVDAARAVSIGKVSLVAPADSRNVPQYSKVEFVVSLSTASTKFFEADPAQGGVDLSGTFKGPHASKFTVKGFYDGSHWLIRFAPTVIGEWRVRISAVDESGRAIAVDVPGFKCVASPFPGFARIDGTYLRFSNGTSFYAVGHNNGWQYDVEQPALSDMAARGENLLSFWMATPWIMPTDPAPQNQRTPIENASEGLGHYDQAACAYIDSVVSHAEAANVYLLPNIWAHDQLNDGTVPPNWPSSWNNNAYSAACSAGDFYLTHADGVDTQQWHFQQNLYRYILARWGYSRAIVGWVAVAEADGTTGYALNSSQVTSWCGSVRTYFAQNDPYRFDSGGQSHRTIKKSQQTTRTPTYPLMVSISDLPAWDNGLDIRAVDCYASKTSDTTAATTLANESATLHAAKKPAVFTEFGGDILNGATQPAHLHNGIWAGTASGAAMSPLLWCDGGNYPMLTDPAVGDAMRIQLQSLSDFVTGIEFMADSALTPTLPDASDPGCHAWALQLNDRGFAWIQCTSGTAIGGQTLTIHNLKNGVYSVAWYDVWSNGGSPFATTIEIAVTNGDLMVTIPSLSRADVACRFYVDASPSLRQP